jgi:hypothetical protein
LRVQSCKIQNRGSKLFLPSSQVPHILFLTYKLNPRSEAQTIEGQLLNENNPLGGEGIILREALTRETFKDNSSVF